MELNDIAFLPEQLMGEHVTTGELFPQETRHVTRIKFEDGVREMVTNKENLADSIDDFCDRGLAYWTNYKKERGGGHPSLADGELVENKIETYRKAKLMLKNEGGDYPRQLAQVVQEISLIATRQIENEFRAAENNREYDFENKVVNIHHFPIFDNGRMLKEVFRSNAGRTRDERKKVVEGWKKSISEKYPTTEKFLAK